LEVLVEQTDTTVRIGPMPCLHADPTQMAQLFQNLISNAIKFRRPDVPPEIEITSEPVDPTAPAFHIPGPGPAFRIMVRDNGIGFDMRHLDRIFGVFQRLHSREEYEGSGIGLAICRSIVERHGGTITAISQPGHGSTFIVILPLRPADGATTRW
ncbi:MAG: ATP-binding protein, partial [Dehalococcoidia bacterium]|nr:ATP-binding protein [Dehalococcoidia bacterium]